MNFDLENGNEMNLRIITKTHQADPGKGFLTKSILKPYGRGTAMPTAWKLNCTLPRDEVFKLRMWGYYLTTERVRSSDLLAP